MTCRRLTRIAILAGATLAAACTAPVATNPAQLEFVIDDIADQQWSHYDDGSFDVHQTVTARVTAPPALRGRTVKVQINAVAEVDTEANVGTRWSTPLQLAAPDDDQLQTLIYRRITKASRGE